MKWIHIAKLMNLIQHQNMKKFTQILESCEIKYMYQIFNLIFKHFQLLAFLLCLHRQFMSLSKNWIWWHNNDSITSYRIIKNVMLLNQFLNYEKFHDWVLIKIIKINKDTKFECDFNNLSDLLSHKMQRNQNQDKFIRNDCFRTLRHVLI